VRKSRLAIVGCGGIAAFAHLPAIWRRSDAAEIRYLCDTNAKRADFLRQSCSLPPTSIVDLETMLTDPELDGVIVAAWPNVNNEIAIRAIEAGKHVLIHKPAALTAAEGASLVNSVAQTDKNVLALPVVEHVPGISDLLPMIKRGALGEISFIRIRVCIPGPADYHRDVRRHFNEDVNEPGAAFAWGYARGAGCSADMGPYALALVYQTLGSAKLSSFHKDKKDFETSCLLTLEAPKAICSIELGWFQYPSKELIIVIGSKATAYVSMTGQLSVNPEALADEAPAEPVIRTKPILPPDPTNLHDRWVDAINGSKEQSFAASVESARWAGGILEQLRTE
jgi:predicted dehydrogenase